MSDVPDMALRLNNLSYNFVILGIVPSNFMNLFPELTQEQWVIILTSK